MPTTYRATLTNVGAALVADAIAQGTTLTWAKMALGDGNGSAVIVDAGRTSLVNERYRAPLNDLGRDSANPNTIVGTLVVPPETGGWTIREFGIYDNASTPRLVAYGETPEIEKPASSAGTGINLRLRFRLVVSADANITLSPDSNEAYATIEYVKDNAVKSLSVSGRTITYTMGDGDTHTIQTQDTTYNDATQSVHGLMSATDKKKLDDVPSTYVKKNGDTVTGEIASSYGATNTSGAVNHFSGTMAVNDGWAIRAGANASNDGYLEIATRDDGTEPIYVRQYTGAFVTLKRTATLLDGSGNTSFPGSVTADGGFVGALTGNASSATQFSANKSVKLTGDVTGEASSKAGWTLATTLANSGVTAGSYGPSADATPAYGATFNVPYITIDAKGRLTAASTKTVKIPAQYSHPTTSGNKHIPSGGSNGQILRWSADGTATWGADNNTTYNDFIKSGSTATHGLVPKPSTTAGTTKYLREDATWQVPPNNTYSNFIKSGSTAAAGLVPKPSTTAGTTKFLREDASWRVPTAVAAQSLTSNSGYIIFASGLILQWGQAAFDGTHTYHQFAMPQPCTILQAFACDLITGSATVTSANITSGISWIKGLNSTTEIRFSTTAAAAPSMSAFSYFIIGKVI